ncbi:hypothetical protein EJ04DRAFT_584374 [Polyplosphaeria fusca]|uniref:superoxide dismutase n=1 Tax=Polyplosphaeria fusca TaxID=682080 RepID=A0A9P4QQX1_9PLEO|nr:hypothetical protein EJ04DRAFT_584374 [Polyplosphaeria fusca]
MHHIPTLLTLLTPALSQFLIDAGAPPSPILLTTTKSGVLPILPTGTPFPGVDTLEGAIINPGPPLPGFTGLGGTATAQSNLPSATYRATMPDTMFDGLVDTTVGGYIEGVGGPDGVRFNINLTGLPDVALYGPFPYHIHDVRVPADGNCTATLGHLDPTNRGELHMCDTSAPETCQVGDLAGKHGKIMAGGAVQMGFTDAYLSMDSGSEAFFGGLSIVLHTSNTTRITCANFKRVAGGNETVVNGTASMSMPVPSGTSTGGPQQYTGAAVKGEAGVGGVVALGILGLFL